VLSRSSEAWAPIITAARKIQLELRAEVEDNGTEAAVGRIIDRGAPIEIVAMLDALGPVANGYQVTADVIQDVDGDGTLIAAWEQRAKTFLCAVLGEGETAGHVHHANGHAALPS
jgi:hypothetical protein